MWKEIKNESMCMSGVWLNREKMRKKSCFACLNNNIVKAIFFKLKSWENLEILINWCNSYENVYCIEWIS